MKTTVVFRWFALAALCVGIFSCSNEIPQENDIKGELIPVSFKVGFDKEITPFRSDETMNPSNFFYYVYNAETGDLYKNLRFYNFTGAINDSLPEGNYTIVFVEVNKDTNLSWNYYPSAIDGSNIKKYPTFFEILTTDFLNTNHDVFYKKTNCLIDKDSSNNYSVTLDRIVGKIEFVLEDVIPSEVSTIEIETGDFEFPISFYYNFNTDFTKGTPFHKSVNITELDKAASGYTLFFITFENINFDQSRYPISIKLTARRSLPEGVVDTGQSFVTSKVIENVDILRNKTVRYSGKLFDNITPPSDTNPSSSFSITGDEEWGETIDKTF
ncbi:MAG: hypothetical protein FWF53_11750 [Candidatus Azobacteroides sp.]|nr:hypothetical protein [Candidatus Azobacteroides sp.]